jgi:hypothetical protein
MNMNAAIWIGTLSSMIAACGGGGNGTGGSGEACKAATPCGGDIEGTWEVTSVCPNGDLSTMVSSMGSGEELPTTCRDLFQNFTIDMAGTITFADGTMISDLVTTVKGREHLTPACMTSLLGSTVPSFTPSSCSEMENELTKGDTSNSATCAAKAGSCDCDITAVSSGTKKEHAYTLSDNQMVDPTGQDDPMGYCVSGTTLILIQNASELGNVDLVLTLRRQ